VIPRPSHPSRRKIRFGIKIRKNIDMINRTTRIVNRWRNGSACMYEVENFRTLAEIKKIVVANVRAVESSNNESDRWWDERERKSHSMIRELAVWEE